MEIEIPSSIKTVERDANDNAALKRWTESFQIFEGGDSSRGVILLVKGETEVVARRVIRGRIYKPEEYIHVGEMKLLKYSFKLYVPHNYTPFTRIEHINSKGEIQIIQIEVEF